MYVQKLKYLYTSYLGNRAPKLQNSFCVKVLARITRGSLAKKKDNVFA